MIADSSYEQRKLERERVRDEWIIAKERERGIRFEESCRLASEWYEKNKNNFFPPEYITDD